MNGQSLFFAAFSIAVSFVFIGLILLYLLLYLRRADLVTIKDCEKRYKELENNLKIIDGAHEFAIKDLRDQYELDIKSLKHSHRFEITIMQNKYEKQIALMETKYETEIEKLKSQVELLMQLNGVNHEEE